MKLKGLLKGIEFDLDGELKGLEVTSISSNSKDVKKGSLFVAIKGYKFDGHRFLKEAFARGAAAAIVERGKNASFNNKRIIQVNDTREAISTLAKNFYHSPSEKLKVVGITGTNGKTTTSLLIESIFTRFGIPCGVIGTIDYKMGGRSIPAERTTPDALMINALLDEMRKSGLKAVAMEVSSHALDQKRVDDVLFDAAIFTNLTHEHLDYHRDLKRYFRSKAKIFLNLKERGVAIINADDGYKEACIRKIVNRRHITYGINKDSDVNAEIGNIGLEGSSFIVKINKKEKFSINTKLLGLHNISNILAAIAAGVAQNIDLVAIKEGIEAVESIPGRLEPVEKSQNFKVFIDYAHTHNALENVLRFLNKIKTGNIITVFGCGGERDRTKRPLMGRVAQRLSDFVIITSDNPRSEDSRKIVRDIEKGMNAKGDYTVLLDRKKAIEKALKKAGNGDIVLIAGKGHEKVQIIGDREIPFNDKRQTEEILMQRAKNNGRESK